MMKLKDKKADKSAEVLWRSHKVYTPTIPEIFQNTYGELGDLGELIQCESGGKCWTNLRGENE